MDMTGKRAKDDYQLKFADAFISSEFVIIIY